MLSNHDMFLTYTIGAQVIKFPLAFAHITNVKCSFIYHIPATLCRQRPRRSLAGRYELFKEKFQRNRFSHYVACIPKYPITLISSDVTSSLIGANIAP